MNGEIRVESEVARGSRFTLRLPLEFVENVRPAVDRGRRRPQRGGGRRADARSAPGGGQRDQPLRRARDAAPRTLRGERSQGRADRPQPVGAAALRPHPDGRLDAPARRDRGDPRDPGRERRVGPCADHRPHRPCAPRGAGEAAPGRNAGLPDQAAAGPRAARPPRTAARWRLRPACRTAGSPPSRPSRPPPCRRLDRSTPRSSRSCATR